MKTCVFAGTFDPITKGHAFVIDSCLKMFDKVIIALGKNVDKKPMFSLEERKEMISLVYKDNKRVQIEEFDGMLIDFMNKFNVDINVRGIRDKDDYKYELTMERFNRDMKNDLMTIFIPTPSELVHVSSKAIRNIIDLKGEYGKYLPEKVNEYIAKKIKS